MTSRIISLRLPSKVIVALTRSAENARWSVSTGLDCLLRNSFEHGELLQPLPDCREFLDAKLDVRIPITTSEQIKSRAGQLGMSISVYIRKLLYHFYITKNVKYVVCNGHYTLAGSHD